MQISCFDSFETFACGFRSNLASVVLQLFALGVSDIKKFDFMDKPSSEVSWVKIKV